MDKRAAHGVGHHHGGPRSRLALLLRPRALCVALALLASCAADTDSDAELALPSGNQTPSEPGRVSNLEPEADADVAAGPEASADASVSHDAQAAACFEPSCACTDGAPARTCAVPIEAVGDSKKPCLTGAMYCRGGKWSQCLTLASYGLTE